MDVSKTGDMIKADPYLLNKMRYADAVVRETLRIFPPGNTVRAGAADFFISDPDTGERYPTDGWLLWSHNLGHMVNPDLWGEDVYSFRPERWLDESNSKGAANRDAFMAFAKGPRNCIGQELAMLETKMMLAMTIRQFGFHEAFAEVEKLKNDGSGYPSDLSGVQEQFGEKAYQIQLGTAKPREAKMGLTPNSAEAQGIAWIEKFFMKTSLLWREKSLRLPYSAAHPSQVVELNAEFQKKLLSLSDDTVRLVCGELLKTEDHGGVRHNMSTIPAKLKQFIEVEQQPHGLILPIIRRIHLHVSLKHEPLSTKNIKLLAASPVTKDNVDYS
ncbi:cytochrome P450, partial [Aureobasidium melanogenum]